ncbi:MAG: hypothetical protein LBC82_05705 [Oscillospiraceae bacterium]|jgi:hypothetical protein|nr:hypothetical protein [Oscillospiraceae bacterium]
MICNRNDRRDNIEEAIGNVRPFERREFNCPEDRRVIRYRHIVNHRHNIINEYDVIHRHHHHYNDVVRIREEHRHHDNRHHKPEYCENQLSLDGNLVESRGLETDIESEGCE